MLQNMKYVDLLEGMKDDPSLLDEWNRRINSGARLYIRDEDDVDEEFQHCVSFIAQCNFTHMGLVSIGLLSDDQYGIRIKGIMRDEVLPLAYYEVDSFMRFFAGERNAKPVDVMALAILVDPYANADKCAEAARMLSAKGYVSGFKVKLSQEYDGDSMVDKRVIEKNSYSAKFNNRILYRDADKERFIDILHSVLFGLFEGGAIHKFTFLNTVRHNKGN